jgi:hypothetical protein
LSNADADAIEARIGQPLDAAHRELLTLFGASAFEDDVVFTPEVPFPKSYSKSNTGLVGSFLRVWRNASLLRDRRAPKLAEHRLGAL